MLKQKTTYYSDYCLTIHGSSTQTIVYLYAGIKCIYISFKHQDKLSELNFNTSESRIFF